MDQIAELFAEYGHLAYPVIFFWTFFEGESIVIFGGYAVHYGVMDGTLLFFVAWFGSFLGDQTWYYVGRYYGPKLLKRFPKWKRGVFHVSELMHHYGVWFILSFRFVYGVRNVSSFTIGSIHYPRIKFLILNFTAAGIWAATFVGLGYGFGVLTEMVATQLPESMLGNAAKAVGFGFLALFLCMVAILLRRHRKRLEAEEQGSARADEGNGRLIAVKVRSDSSHDKS